MDDDNKNIPPGADWEERGESDTLTQDRDEPREPRKYRVLLINDDYTTMEFVVMILMTVFHHSEQQSVEIMLQVHHEGMGLAGIYSFDVAETKVNKVHTLARQNQFPLRCIMEPE